MYLITVKYDNDAERKRMEYIFEKWAGKLNIVKPEGIVAIINELGEESLVQDFIKDLLSRSSQTSRNGINVYRLETDCARYRETRKRTQS